MDDNKKADLMDQLVKVTGMRRFYCAGTCGWTWDIDNLYICDQCRKLYCYECIWKFEQLSKHERKCRCGGILQ